MELRAAKLEASDDVVDNPRESAKITSRARSRIAELLQKPFDVRSISLTGLFILALFYTMYFMRSVLLPVVLAVLLSFLLGSSVVQWAGVRSRRWVEVRCFLSRCCYRF